ncbi:hypothetical protein [Lactiplantibacillus plantarum]
MITQYDFDAKKRQILGLQPK